MSELPEVVYKFVNPAIARLMLGKMTVRYTPLPELNDPAESPFFNGNGLLTVVAAHEISEFTGRAIDEIDGDARFVASRTSLDATTEMHKSSGVLCLSGAQALTYSPMWAHYACNHKGLAIGFATDCKAVQGRSGLGPVNYAGMPVPGSNVLFCKRTCWQHEHEFRATCTLPPPPADIPPDFDLGHYEKFSVDDMMDIVVGSRCDRSMWKFLLCWLASRSVNPCVIRHCVLNPAGHLEIVKVMPILADRFIRGNEPENELLNYKMEVKL